MHEAVEIKETEEADAELGELPRAVVLERPSWVQRLIDYLLWR